MNTKKDGSLNLTSEEEVMISKKATVSDLKALGCEKMGLEPPTVRLWNTYTGSTKSSWGKELKDSAKTLEDATIIDGQKIVFEVQLEDGSWPKSGRSSSGGSSTSFLKKLWPSYWFGSGDSANNANGNSNNHHHESQREEEHGVYIKGVCGLYNLGMLTFVLNPAEPFQEIPVS